MRERKRGMWRWGWCSRINSKAQAQSICQAGAPRSDRDAPGAFLAWSGCSCRLKGLTMAEKIANFVPVSVLDKRKPTKREILRGLVRQAPFVAKNFQLYFRNAWRRNIIGSKVVVPYAVTFYVTHKCNLACSYCTQKEPDVFSDELPTATTIGLLRRIRNTGSASCRE